jgi:hypothetical protein
MYYDCEARIRKYYQSLKLESYKFDTELQILGRLAKCTECRILRHIEKLGHAQKKTRKRKQNTYKRTKKDEDRDGI